MRCRPVPLRVAVLLALAVNGCQPQGTPGPTPSAPPASVPTTVVPAPAVPRAEATEDAVERAKEALQNAANRDRRMRAALTFEEFKATVYREPFEGGKYIVNGDTAIVDEKGLQEFYKKSIEKQQGKFAIHQVDGMDAKWNQQQKRSLTYCVSRSFGPRYDSVVQQMASATGEWEKAAALDFIHDSSQDGNCTASNTAVVFDVRPVNVNEEYLARAFFPNEPRAARNVLIDESSFNLPPGENLQLVGILRHELGHTIGARHEHTRPESGACFEDRDWRPLTGYDAFSVMHYPQCNGRGDWKLELTETDRSGVACVYGAAPGFTIDPTLLGSNPQCATDQPAPSPAPPQVESFTGQSVNAGAQKPYGPFAVAPGSLFEVHMGGAGGSGDPDLYVRFGAAPTRFPVPAYDCRPFLLGPVEVCALTVPASATRAFVMVHGYGSAQGTYDLEVKRVPPAGPAAPAARTPR